MPNTRLIGCATLPPVYWVIGLGSGNPQSHGAERRIARVAKRWISTTAKDAEKAMKANTSRPL